MHIYTSPVEVEITTGSRKKRRKNTELYSSNATELEVTKTVKDQ